MIKRRNGQRATRNGSLIAHCSLLIALLCGAAHAVDLNTLPTNTWVETHPTYTGQPNGGSLCLQAWNNKGVYDPASQRVISFDRWCDPIRGGSIYANALLAYDPVSEVVAVKVSNWKAQPCALPETCGYKTIPLPENTTEPTPVDRHPLGSFALAPDFNKVYLSNGLNQSTQFNNDGEYGNPITDTWAFDLGAWKWSKVSETHSQTDPTNPWYSGPDIMTYDPANHVIALFDHTFQGGPRTWLLNPASGQWSKLPIDPSAASVMTFGSGITYDTRRSRIVVFGSGLDYSDQYQSGHLWAYSVDQNKWTQLADCPMNAPLPGFDYDSNHDIFLALIGTHTWVYDPNVNVPLGSWSKIQAPIRRVPEGNPNLGKQPVTYDPAHDVFVFMGGNSGFEAPQWIVFRYSAAPSAPTITQHPSNRNEVVGQNAIFTVFAAGTPAPTYQWQSNSGSGWSAISGATSAVYTKTNVQLSNSGTQFRCVVTNSQGSATSNAALLTVSPPPPPAGWQKLTNTKLTSVCPSPSPGGSGGCATVILAWGGAAARTKAGQEQMILWGGGHGDYYGNEVYSLNLSVNPPTMTRLNNPSVVDMNGGDTYVSDGLPVSRHTYNGLAYLPGSDRMFSFEGARMPNGSGGGFTWTLDLSVSPPVWHKMYPSGGADLTTGGSVTGASCAYDPNTDSVLCNWGNLFQFLRYTFSNNTWTKVTNTYDSIVPSAATAVIDPVRKRMYIFGPDLPNVRTSPSVVSVDISAGSNFAVNDITAQTNQTCDALAGVNWPGLAYDSAIDRIVGWPNTGDTVYIFDPNTNQCTAQTFPNGPQPTSFTGTFGRFAYYPSLNAFAVVAQADQDAYLLRLSTGLPPPPPPPPPPSTPPPPPSGNNVTPVGSVALNPLVYPNPWKSDRHGARDISFDNITAGVTLKIFTTSGHLIKEAVSTGTSMTWNRTNDKGDKVASGVYVWLVTDSAGNKAKGKVAVVK